MIFLYYDNPLMLAEQVRCWNTYLDFLKNTPTLIVVDDGSPSTQAVKVLKKCPCRVPIRVFRIREDIPWNFSGARNLGCLHANDWIYMSDIDTLLYGQDASNMFEGRTLDENCFYMPKRIYLPGLETARPAIVNLLFHKAQYLASGGYDEDYAGYYGREESDFLRRLKRVANLVECHDACVRVMSPSIIHDARSRGRPRDKTRNAALFDQKRAAGFPKPVNPMRFTWERVL